MSTKQKICYDVLNSNHLPYIRQLCGSVVTEEENFEHLVRYIRTFGNPMPKIVHFLSQVHTRPVVRTTGDAALDRRIFSQIDMRSVALAQYQAEMLANAIGDAFVVLALGWSGKIEARAVGGHEARDPVWEADGRLAAVTIGSVRYYLADRAVQAPGGAITVGFCPCVHYALTHHNGDWCVSQTYPLAELAIEIGFQIALFLETGYLRSHEQITVEQLPSDWAAGDMGDVPIGTRKVINMPLRAVKLIDPETAQKFFQGVQDLTIFVADQYGIPRDWFLQDMSNLQTAVPPGIRDRWQVDCMRWSLPDAQCMAEAAALAGITTSTSDWTIQYLPPRGQESRVQELVALEKEIQLGVNNPAWFAYSTDGDFQTIEDARAWIAENLEEWAKIVEIKAERNIAVNAQDRTPEENGADGGTLSPDYDGAAGPRVLPPESFAK